MVLKKSCFTRQKLKITAFQRVAFLQMQFISEVSLYDRDMMIFVDEAGKQ